MNPLQTLDKEALLDVLTEYYQKYRDAVETNWNMKECTLYHESLMAIHGELERRRDDYSTENQQRGSLGVPRP